MFSSIFNLFFNDMEAGVAVGFIIFFMANFLLSTIEWILFSLCGKQFYKRGECPSNTFRNTFRKKSTKPLNNDIYFDEEDRAQNQSNTSMGVKIIKYMNMKDEITLWKNNHIFLESTNIKCGQILWQKGFIFLTSFHWKCCATLWKWCATLLYDPNEHT